MTPSGRPNPQPHARTLRAPASIEGRGLFTAATAAVTIRPARAGEGISFRRGEQRVPAHIDALSDDPIHPAFAALPPRCTILRSPGEPGAPIATVEHLLAAIAGLGVTDAIIEIDAPEVPIDDGSAAAFVDAILAAGLVDLDAPADPLRVERELRVESGDASVTISPADAPEYIYDLDYGAASPIAAASVRWSGDPDAFATQIAPARTFCLQQEAEAMTAMGLFKDLSPRDMLVIGADGPIDNDYRFEDEPARHKLLDLVGDLALVGRPLIARVHAVRAGHALNHAAARAILDSLA